MGKKSLSFKIGLALAVIHLCIVSILFWLLPSSGQSAIGILFVLCVIDFFVAPLFYLPASRLARLYYGGMLIPNGVIIGWLIIISVFAILGTIGWFYIPILIAKTYKGLFKKL